jgi:O-antigen/teichoic acid export membrane protein
MQDGETKKHLRGSSLLLVGKVLVIGLNFVIQVLMVRYLAKQDFGAFAYALSLVLLGASAARLGLEKPLSYFVPVFEEQGAREKMAGTIVFVLGTVLGLGVSLVLLVIVCQGLLARHVVSNPLSLSLLLVLVYLVPVHAVEDVLERLFAIFAGARALFLRRHVVGPLMKFTAVLALVVFHTNVYVFAVVYLITNTLGTVYSITVLTPVLRQRGLLGHLRWSSLSVPKRKILGFGLPLLVTEVALQLRTTLVTFLLELWHGTLGVAAFRAVLPVARLNTVATESFKMLFIPTAARMFARDDHAMINQLYWKNAAWVAVLTFPVFVVSFALAEPLTVLLFGHRYADSGAVLSWLALGCYVSAAFGFNAQLMRVYGKVRQIVVNDLLTAVVAIGSSLLLIQDYGAVGGAIAYSAALVLQNVLNEWSLIRTGEITSPPWRSVQSYVSIVGVAAAVFMVQWLSSPSLVVGMVLAALGSLVVVWWSLPALDVAGTFPELLNWWPIRKLLASSPRVLEGEQTCPEN